MKPRGMRIISGNDARLYRTIINQLSDVALDNGFSEIILPNVWGFDTFQEKYEKIRSQM